MDVGYDFKENKYNIKYNMEKIQELTEKIYREGVEKGQAEAERIIEEGRQKAADIVNEAKKQAEALLAQAKKQAVEVDTNTKNELKLYTNQALNALKSEVANVLTCQVVKKTVGDLVADKEFLGQFAVALAQTVPQVVHRAARPLAVLVAAAVVDTQEILREVGHHTEEGGDPHPEHGTGAARDDGGGYARDVTRTDGGGQGGAEGLELGNGLAVGLLGGVAVLLEHAGDGVLPPVTHVNDLEHLGAHGQKDTRTDEQDEAGKTPDRAVDGIVDGLHPIEKRFHVCFLHENKIKNDNKNK